MAECLRHVGVQIMQQPETALFSAPVSDADAPGYSSVVGTIKGRLQRKKYMHPAEVYADVRQVLRLCCTPGMHSGTAVHQPHSVETQKSSCHTEPL